MFGCVRVCVTAVYVTVLTTVKSLAHPVVVCFMLLTTMPQACNLALLCVIGYVLPPRIRSTFHFLTGEQRNAHRVQLPPVSALVFLHGTQPFQTSTSTFSSLTFVLTHAIRAEPPATKAGTSAPHLHTTLEHPPLLPRVLFGMARFI